MKMANYQNILLDLFTSTTAWIVTLCLLLIIIFQFQRQRRFKRMPPSPKRYPIIGNLLEFWTTRTMLEIMRDYRNRYGNVFTIWMFMKPVVVVYDWELYKECNALDREDFMGRPQIPLLKQLIGSDSDLVLADYTEDWSAMRKLGQRSIRKAVEAGSWANDICRCVDEMAIEMMNEKKPFETKEYLHLLCLNAISPSIWGKMFRRNDPGLKSLKDFHDTFYNVSPTLLLVLFFPALSVIFRKSHKRLYDILNSVISMVDNCFSERNTLKDEKYDMIQYILENRKEPTMPITSENESTNKITNRSLRILISELVLAGTDVLALVMSWVLLLLSNFPDVQEKVYQEIKSEIGDREPTPEDMASCPYLRAVLTECLRFRTLSPYGIPRKTVRDTTIGNFQIPADTVVAYYVNGFHLEPSSWTDPEQFRPERFLDPEGRFVSHDPSRQFSPFGYGKRICIGERISKKGIFLITSRLVQQCKLGLEGGPSSVNLVPSNLALFNLPKPYKLCVTKRD